MKKIEDKITQITDTRVSLTTNKRRYRVVLIHPNAGVNWSGGSEIFAIEMARHLCPYFDVELLSGAECSDFSYPSGGIPRAYTYHAVRHPLISPVVHRVATHPEIVIEHLTNFLPCTIHILRKNADIIFPCNDYGGMAMAAFVRAIRGTPILYTEHNSLLGNGYPLARNLRFRPDRLVVLSAEVAAFVRKLQPKQPVSIIPNGVDIERFTPKGTRIDFGLTKPVVLCVASLHCNNHKRVELAMQAVARLPQASLLVCGDGPDRAYFQAKGEQLLGLERFAIKSFPYEQMPQVYRSADVFTLPSAEEPFGFAYIEAMACGIPVVATDDEMRRYLVADGGILCDVTNADIYADAITKALQGDWLQPARNNSLRFSWDAIALRYRDLILQTISQSQKA
jgi:glycosyltransferase involved in cell wall biosynthesis